MCSPMKRVILLRLRGLDRPQLNQVDFHDETIMKAKRRVCGERGSAKIAYTKLVHQKYLPRSSAKVSGISLQSVLLLAHHSTNCPRTALGSTKVTRLPRR